jgi:hypothetical protein
MARFFFEFDGDDGSDNVAEMATLEAAVVAAAASLARTAFEEGAGRVESLVIVGDDKGARARVSLSIKIEPMSEDHIPSG